MDRLNNDKFDHRALLMVIRKSTGATIQGHDRFDSNSVLRTLVNNFIKCHPDSDDVRRRYSTGRRRYSKDFVSSSCFPANSYYCKGNT